MKEIEERFRVIQEAYEKLTKLNQQNKREAEGRWSRAGGRLSKAKRERTCDYLFVCGSMLCVYTLLHSLLSLLLTALKDEHDLLYFARLVRDQSILFTRLYGSPSATKRHLAGEFSRKAVSGLKFVWNAANHSGKFESLSAALTASLRFPGSPGPRAPP